MTSCADLVSLIDMGKPARAVWDLACLIKDTYPGQGCEISDDILHLRSATHRDDDFLLFQADGQEVCRAVLRPGGCQLHMHQTKACMQKSFLSSPSAMQQPASLTCHSAQLHSALMPAGPHSSVFALAHIAADSPASCCGAVLMRAQLMWLRLHASNRLTKSTRPSPGGLCMPFVPRPDGSEQHAPPSSPSAWTGSSQTRPHTPGPHTTASLPGASARPRPGTAGLCTCVIML